MSRYGTYDLEYGFIPDDDYQEPQKPITNADRIRSMSDEELAEAMHSKLAMDCLNCPALKADCPAWETKNVECKDAMLDWLKKECE